MDLAGKTILIVEDEAIFAVTEKTWLKREGYNVKHVLSGEDAVKEVNENPDSIDLILMDINLGRGMDGTEAAGMILKTHDIPLLFLSSHTEKSIVKLTEEITNYGYVVKGSGETVLLASIKMAFKLFHQKRENLQQEAKLHETAENLAITLKSIREKEELFRTLVENAPVPLTIARHGITIYSNSEFVSMLGFNCIEELIGKHLSDHIAPEDKAKAIDIVLRRENGGDAPKNYEIMAIKRDGKKIPILVQTSRIMMPEGMATIAAFTDLTEHYQLNQALRENEVRLNLVMEAGNIGFWDWNTLTGEVHRNEQWAGMLGYSCDEIENTTQQWLDFIHPDDIQKVMESVSDILEGRSRGHKMEYRLVAKSGDVRWIYDHSMVTDRGTDGKPIRMSGINLDITQRKLNEIRLGYYTDELKASNAVKDKFFSIISHDLKGPFMGFLGLTEELASNIENMDKKDISEIAGIMHRSAEQTYELLLNLLEWSHLQTGRFEFDPQILNLYSEVEGINKLFSSAAQRKFISIQNETDRNVNVKADQNALRTILRNLIDNAIKFSNDGGTVLINSQCYDGFIQISVKDSGIGISSEALDKIFTLNSGITTKGTKGEKGSGLGLSLCQDLIRRCGGKLEAKSLENEGTEFIFSLPV